MGPKQAMALDLTTATRAELLKAESVLFRAKMKTMSGSPLQREYSEKYWQVRAAMPDFSAVPKSQNGSLRFKSASERDTAFRMLKAARVKFPGVLQKAVDNRTGVYLILFPGASQLVTAAHWENAQDTAGVQSNPQFTRPSLIGSVVDTYFPVDLMEGSVKGAVEDLKDLVGSRGSGGRKRK